MHYFLYSTKDTTISNHPSLLAKNMGLDEILEVEKTISNPSCSGGKGAVLSRTLIHFNLTDISSSLSAGDITDPQFYLALKIAESAQVPTSYNIAAYPVGKSWDMGTQYKYDGASSADGASWKYSDSGSVKWYNPIVSSSYSTNCDGGGVWHISSSSLASGSGYAEPPFVSPNPYNPFPNCTDPASPIRFKYIALQGAILDNNNSASLEAKLYSGSTATFFSLTATNSGPTVSPTSFTLKLYDEGILVSSLSGSGTTPIERGITYNTPSGSSFPRTLTLVAENSSSTPISVQLSIDGNSVSSSIVPNDHSAGSVSAIFGDVLIDGYMSNPTPISASTLGYVTGSLIVTLDPHVLTNVGGTDIYAKYSSGSYVSSSVLTTSIVGTSIVNLSNNPAGEWLYNSGGIISSSAVPTFGSSGSYELAILTDVPSTLSFPYVFTTGSFGAVQSFNYESSDIYMDVTRMVMAWIYGVIPNNGMILLHSDESSSYDYGKLRFFSKESNTIYQPHLDVMWSDVSLSPTGSDGILTLADTSKPSVVSSHTSKEYKSGAIVRINVLGRPQYPVKTFTNRVSDYTEPMRLPDSSYYSIRDSESEEIIVGFDSYTQLSSDGYGNYFMLDTTGLPQERYYRVEIRSEISGSINTFSSPTTFKISR